MTGEAIQTAISYLTPILAALGIAGVIWRAVSWHNGLVAKIDAIAAESKHQHELQAEQLRSVQAELAEFKDESKRNFTKLYSRIDDLSERIARLEGRK